MGWINLWVLRTVKDSIVVDDHEGPLEGAEAYFWGKWGFLPDRYKIELDYDNYD